MKTLVTMTLSVSEDGPDTHVSDSTQTHGNEWKDVLRGMVILRDEIDRQIREGSKCPFNPRNIHNNGEPRFEK